MTHRLQSLASLSGANDLASIQPGYPAHPTLKGIKMIRTSENQSNSEVDLMSNIYKLSDAGAAVIQVRTREPIRTAMTLRKNLIGAAECQLKEWDVISGFRNFSTENFTNNITPGAETQFWDALMTPLLELRKPGSSILANPRTVHYFVYVDAHPYIAGNPLAAELIQQYAAILPSTNVCIIFITPDVTLEGIPPGTIMTTEMKTPSGHELQALLEKIITATTEDFSEPIDISEEEHEQIAQLGLGLTLFEFETYAALAIVDAGIRKAATFTAQDMLDGIALGKTTVVKQSEILELYPSVGMDEVGGMAYLKSWLESRKACFSEEARDFGVEPPKGAVVVGVPGTGKSLVAKAIASVFGIPLVRFDIGRVFSKYVGDSESRVRNALAMVEAMAPCVLFIDEIDKGLSGTANGGDGGVSSRVLGTLLTWLNDCKAPVFTMVTANRVEGLPPELLRKGRFDQIFSVGMPTADEREEVLDIHLRKRGHEIEFDKNDMMRFTMHSEQYVPAEIEAAVKDALILAFNEGEGATLQMQHIVSALQSMVPMSRSNAAQIAGIVEWAANNAIPVNYEPKASHELTPPVGARRIRNRAEG